MHFLPIIGEAGAHGEAISRKHLFSHCDNCSHPINNRPRHPEGRTCAAGQLSARAHDHGVRHLASADVQNSYAPGVSATELQQGYEGS
jgi:hypothetical protein